MHVGLTYGAGWETGELGQGEAREERHRECGELHLGR